MEQLSEKLRDEGIKTAIEHANSTIHKWSHIATNFALNYIRHNDVFMTEDLREASFCIVPEPPSKRAWGAIITKLAKAGLIRHSGYMSVKNPKAHKTPASIWISNVYKYER